MARSGESPEGELDLVTVYGCFGDATRLRILHLLMQSPLCVCHIESILGGPQAKISRHLAYLRRCGLVRTTRYHTWNIYHVVASDSRMLRLQLDCFRECARDLTTFRSDQRALATMRNDVRWIAKFITGKPFPPPRRAEHCGPNRTRKER